MAHENDAGTWAATATSDIASGVTGDHMEVMRVPFLEVECTQNISECSRRTASALILKSSQLTPLHGKAASPQRSGEAALCVGMRKIRSGINFVFQTIKRSDVLDNTWKKTAAMCSSQRMMKRRNNPINLRSRNGLL